MAKRKRQMDPAEEAFRGMIHQRLGGKPPEPDTAIQDAWTSLEEAVMAVSESAKQLEPEVQDQLAEGLSAAADAVEAMEDLLVAAGWLRRMIFSRTRLKCLRI